MKKISVLILAVIASVSASAARVSMTTPAAEGAASYEFEGQTHNVFKNFIKDEVFQQHNESLGATTCLIYNP